MAAKENAKKLIDAIMDERIGDAIDLLADNIDFHYESRGDNPIHVAARTGKLELIKKMKSKKADLQQKNVNGNTPMHYAAREGNIDIVQYLKSNGANLNAINKDGESPLHLAVIMQPMDVIEALVDIGMDPNVSSKESGQTPLHTALMFGRMEAMEGLLIKHAKSNVRNKKNQRPEDLAKNSQIRECLRMYGALLTGIESGYIKAKGMRLTKDFLRRPQMIERVDIILENVDIPGGFSTKFYCRREKSENATVKLPKNEEEHVFSDVFHIRISDANRDCPAKINLPLYAAPSDKEEMLLRFIDYEAEDRALKSATLIDKVNYCLLDVTLIPESTLVCVVFVRPRKEEKTISEAGMLIKSEIEENFTMDVPPGAFQQETTLSLKVFDSNNNDFVGDSMVPDENNAESEKSNAVLLSDVFQINVTGQQPKKGVKMQIPLGKHMKGVKNAQDIAIVTGDETALDKDNALEVTKTIPQIINGMVIFEVSHFCIYVPVFRERVASETDLRAVQKRISSAVDRKKPGVFFVVARKIDDLKHMMMVECLGPQKSADRRQRLVSKRYEVQSPDESEAIMMTPGDTFNISLHGRASFEDDSDANRKLTFSPNRASSQGYPINLDKHVRHENDAVVDIIINKELDDGGQKEISRLKVQLHPPPPPQPRSGKNENGPMSDDALYKLELPDTEQEDFRSTRAHSSMSGYSSNSITSRRSSDGGLLAGNEGGKQARKIKKLVNIYQPKRTPRK